MIRLLVLVMLASLACKALFGRWPWEYLALPPSPISRDRARALLGVEAGATREQVIDAHRRLVFQIHPDRGGTNDLVHEANAARDLLLADLARGAVR